MPRCPGCGFVIAGHDCPNCPPEHTVRCRRCGAEVTVINEAHLKVK